MGLVSVGVRVRRRKREERWGRHKSAVADGEGSKQRSNTKKEGKSPVELERPNKKETVSFYSLANAPDPTNSPNPRSPATRADDDGVGAVESDKAIQGVCYFAGDVFED